MTPLLFCHAKRQPLHWPTEENPSKLLPCCFSQMLHQFSTDLQLVFFFVFTNKTPRPEKKGELKTILNFFHSLRVNFAVKCSKIIDQDNSYINLVKEVQTLITDFQQPPPIKLLESTQLKATALKRAANLTFTTHIKLQ